MRTLEYRDQFAPTLQVLIREKGFHDFSLEDWCKLLEQRAKTIELLGGIITFPTLGDLIFLRGRGRSEQDQNVSCHSLKNDRPSITEGHRELDVNGFFHFIKREIIPDTHITASVDQDEIVGADGYVYYLWGLDRGWRIVRVRTVPLIDDINEYHRAVRVESELVYRDDELVKMLESSGASPRRILEQLGEDVARIARRWEERALAITHLSTTIQAENSMIAQISDSRYMPKR